MQVQVRLSRAAPHWGALGSAVLLALHPRVQSQVLPELQPHTATHLHKRPVPDVPETP